MKVDKNKIDIAIARKKLTIPQLAKEYGVSRSRMNIIINSRNLTPVCVGRLAAALGVDVTEITESGERVER